MFEAQTGEKSGGGAGMWIGVAVVLVVAVVLGWYVMKPKGAADSGASASSAPAGTPATAADPVHDLRVVSVKMDKDTTGTVAVWSVDLRDLSRSYGYKDIAYQTTYIGRDGSVLLQNTGKLNISLDAGDEQTTQFRDALYPSGTAVFRFKVTGASTTK